MGEGASGTMDAEGEAAVAVECVCSSGGGARLRVLGNGDVGGLPGELIASMTFSGGLLGDDE